MSNFEFPHTRTYDEDLGWLINAVKNLKETMETFVATESLKFADPITWNITTQYEKSTIVIDPSGNAYLSLQPVPAGIQLNNDEYWLEIFNFTAYTRTANRNLTVNVETNTTRATANYAEDDWLIWNDVLYNVIAPITLDDELVVDTNIEHFTVEQFIKNWVTYATNLINQYKNDIDASELAYKNEIDASELAYRNQLAQDIANTTASLQAQLNAAIAGATVDSEVINARVGWDNTVYNTLGEAIRTQITDIHDVMLSYAGIIPNNTDFDTIKSNSYMSTMDNYTYSNSPFPRGSVIVLHTSEIATPRDGTIWLQYALNPSNNVIKYRSCDLQGVWTAWKTLDYLNYNGIIPNNTDLDTIKSNIYMSSLGQYTYIHSPFPTHTVFMLNTFEITTPSDGTLWRQYATNVVDNVIYVRTCNLQGVWNDWSLLDVYSNYSGIIPNNTDLDTIKSNTYMSSLDSYTYTHSPFPARTIFMLNTFEIATPRDGSLWRQYATNVVDNATYFRTCGLSGVWDDWRKEDLKSTTSKYFAFGDSVTYGQTENSGRSNNNYPSIAAKLMNITLSNQAVGGQGLIKDWNTIQNNYINNLDMTGAKIITIGWAYNDVEYYPTLNFGSYTDTNDETFIGKYYTIMKDFQEKCPTAMLILVTGYGHSDGVVGPPVVKPTLNDQFSHLYTFLDGTVSAGDMYDELEKMCNLNGWSCINQRKGTVFNKFNADAVIGDQIHPNEYGYILYGNFIGAKISGMFGNVSL